MGAKFYMHQGMYSLTASLQIREAAFPTRFTADIQKYRPSRLIIGRIEEISLLERGIGMRRIARVQRKMVNLQSDE